MDKRLVCVKHGYEPWKMAYDALSRVFVDDITGKQILLKPNIGRKGEANTAVCTSGEVVRGVIRFIKEKQASEIYVGDGAIWGVDVWQAMESSGIAEVCREEGVTCVNLDEAKAVVKEIPGGLIVDKLKFSSLVFDVDMVISVPVIKTHMYTGATLSIKNMKGCLYKMEKTILHRINKPSPDPKLGRCLDFGISDMCEVLLPDYSVLDGTVCMEGFGPSVGTAINLDLVAASKDPTAADFTAIKLMGMESADVSHVNLVHMRCKTAGEEDIEVEPADYIKWGKKFKSANLSGLKNICPNIKIVEKGTCSACSAAVMTFIINMNEKFPDDYNFTLATGKDLELNDIYRENTFLIGNCAMQSALRLEADVDCCKGCPPVASSILGYIKDKNS